jgi:hypothetical protein
MDDIVAHQEEIFEVVLKNGSKVYVLGTPDIEHCKRFIRILLEAREEQ